MFLSSSQPGFSAIFLRVLDQVEEPDVTKKVPNLDQTLGKQEFLGNEQTEVQKQAVSFTLLIS